MKPDYYTIKARRNGERYWGIYTSMSSAGVATPLKRARDLAAEVPEMDWRLHRDEDDYGTSKIIWEKLAS